MGELNGTPLTSPCRCYCLARCNRWCCCGCNRYSRRRSICLRCLVIYLRILVLVTRRAFKLGLEGGTLTFRIIIHSSVV